jgi:transposase
MVTQLATGSDDAGLTLTLEEQKKMGLEKPAALYVDGAYVSAHALAQAQEEQRELMGPAQAAPDRPVGFGVDQFDVDIDRRVAICPAGHESTQCSRIKEEGRQKVEYRFEWSWRCRGCSQRGGCVSSTQVHRTIRVGEHHMALQARRRDMETDVFKKRMRQRAGIEGTHSELVRGHGARRARYRGLAKVRLQNYFVGAACNVKRWLRRTAWEMKQGSRLQIA